MNGTPLVRNIGRTGFKVERFTMAGLAQLLSIIMKRPITDGTGLSGKYDLNLHWEADQNGSDVNDPEVNPEPILIAIQQQLGLRLEETKVKLECVVIDSAETPEDN